MNVRAWKRETCLNAIRHLDLLTIIAISWWSDTHHF